MADNVASDYRGAWAEAKKANEDRWKTTIAGYDQQIGTYKSQAAAISKGFRGVSADIAHVGESQRLALQDQYMRQLGQSRAALYSRGLGNSTIMESAERGAGRDLTRGQIQLMDSLARERSQVDLARLGYQGQYQHGLAGLTGGKLGFMERRTDSYPDLGMYANLARMQGMGAAGFPGQGGVTVGGFGAGSRGGAMPGGYGGGGQMTRQPLPPNYQSYASGGYIGSRDINAGGMETNYTKLGEWGQPATMPTYNYGDPNFIPPGLERYLYPGMGFGYQGNDSPSWE